MAPTTTVYEPRISMDSQNYASGSDDDEKMEDVLSSWVPMTSPEEVKAGRSYFFFQDFIRSPETGYVMNAYFEHFYKEKFQSFHVREDDVYLITFPRSGTTWSQELVWCIANDLDFEGAKEQLVKRSPFLEYDALLPPGGLTRLPSPLRDLAEKAQEQGGSDPTKVSLPGRHLEFIDKCPSPRLIKTHLPLSLLPADVRRKKCKIIYVARDARDVCVSSYHLFRGIAGYTGSLEQYVSNFLSGTAMWGPHWKHVLDHWQLRHEPNMLFFTYEDMKANLPNVIDRICNFLGKKFSPEDQARLSEHVSFASMRANEAVAFENNYANVTQRILKPVQEMGLSLENLIEIAADGRLSKVPLVKVLRLIVSGKIPLSVVSSVVAAKVKGRRIALTPGQIAALTGGSLSSEMCSEIARLSSGEASADGSSQPGTPSKKDQNGTNNNISNDRSSSCDNKKNSAKKNGKIDEPANGKKPSNKEKSPSKTSSSSFKTNFFRKGVVGDGKTTLTPAQNAAFDEYDRNHFASAGLPYGKV